MSDASVGSVAGNVSGVVIVARKAPCRATVVINAAFVAICLFSSRSLAESVSTGAALSPRSRFNSFNRKRVAQ